MVLRVVKFCLTSQDPHFLYKMQTGTALFFGLLLVAITILYHSTKDRWNWKKMTKRSLLIPIGLIGLGVLIWLYFTVEEKIENRAKKQTGLQNVMLGDSKNDVIFKKGNPDKGSDQDSLKDLFIYPSYDNFVIVLFKEDKVSTIDYQCKSDSAYKECPSYFSLNGISFKESLKDVEKRLGKPSSIKCSQEDKTFRIFSYKKYQTEYAIDKDGVFSISIFDSNLSDGSNLKECDKSNH